MAASILQLIARRYDHPQRVDVIAPSQVQIIALIRSQKQSFYGLSSIKPNDNSSGMSGTQEVTSRLVIARRNRPVSPQLSEKVLNQMSRRLMFFSLRAKCFYMHALLIQTVSIQQVFRLSPQLFHTFN